MRTRTGKSKIKVLVSLVFVATLLRMCRMNASKRGSHFVDVNLRFILIFVDFASGHARRRTGH